MPYYRGQPIKQVLTADYFNKQQMQSNLLWTNYAKLGKREDYPYHRHLVLAKNNSNEDLPAFSPAKITGSIVEYDKLNNRSDSHCFEVYTMEDDCAFLVIQAKSTPGSIVPAVMEGMTHIRVVIEDMGHRYAKASSNYRTALQSSSEGPAEIIWKPEIEGELPQEAICLCRFNNAPKESNILLVRFLDPFDVDFDTNPWNSPYWQYADAQVLEGDPPEPKGRCVKVYHRTPPIEMVYQGGVALAAWSSELQRYIMVQNLQPEVEVIVTEGENDSGWVLFKGLDKLNREIPFYAHVWGSQITAIFPDSHCIVKPNPLREPEEYYYPLCVDPPTDAPFGTIVMSNEFPPPPGWELCDGTNGKPNLISRFPCGHPGFSEEGSSTHNHETHSVGWEHYHNYTDLWYASGSESARVVTHVHEHIRDLDHNLTYHIPPYDKVYFYIRTH